MFLQETNTMFDVFLFFSQNGCLMLFIIRMDIFLMPRNVTMINSMRDM